MGHGQLACFPRHFAEQPTSLPGVTGTGTGAPGTHRAATDRTATDRAVLGRPGAGEQGTGQGQPGAYGPHPRLLVNSENRRASRIAAGQPEYPLKVTITG
ncbi:hypothetical protein, partial [Streptomyces anulatus]|uniref:hypothetical protein n=1 Tax=Streptomyces anulatus TaxID=1892 RepID=UPI003D9DE766